MLTLLAPTPLAPPLRLLTFDLDDTLFPIAPVVDRANTALADALIRAGVVDASPSTIQGRIKLVRTASDVELTYSDLRLHAISSLLADVNDGQTPETSQVESLFDVWLDERQAAANDLLYPGAAEGLRAICKKHGPSLTVGAVTNGRGDPRGMPKVASCFEFCLSGEEPGIFPDRKPSVRVYEHTLQRACALPPIAGGAPRASVEALRGAWVHVGDSLLNDAQAAHRAGARTVWLEHADADLAAASYSTASAEETERRRAAAEAALSTGCVDVKISEIAELPEALEALLGLRGGSGHGCSSMALPRR